ncbi:hypothetical protein SYJ56_02460 [Algoriphagus sp. D3-2-R+10]|uniref:hypothetical protein n=1 Tax=Algoriphagus aurantiacus TaxID=3103948 RepID=UPI002B3C2532|nr:hypothetical protein [Algoriphagus sp. D3-2-R+10]MEB2774148.1 hypothetical protein [Algoriphagus sp. D3-2-R+10]
MQETWILSLPKSDQSISDQIQQVLTDNQKELGIYLSYYFKKDGALAEKVDLGSTINFNDQSSGNFELEFDLVHFNACLAIHEQKRDHIKITFEIEDNKLNLKGPYWPERGMDEI